MLLVYSGGMDSTVLLYKEADNIKLVVTFDYASKHNAIEYEHAVRNTKRLGIEHIKIDLDFMDAYFKSDLLKSGGAVPDGHYEQERMKSTVVPFRNGIMLSIAAGLAESNDLSTVLIANHAGDHAIYPDCRQSFISPMQEAISQGTYAKIKLLSPFMGMSKRDIAITGRDLGVNWQDTWSCYKGGKIHCGRCGTCQERKEALAGFDSTEYEY